MHLAHDKGLRNGLARLVIELSYRDPDFGLPKTIRIGCEGSHGTSDDVALSIKHTLDNIKNYCLPGKSPTTVASYSTDSGGGGVGKTVVEASRQLSFIHDTIMYWFPCIMHALNRTLQESISKYFGVGELGKMNVVQLAHTCWTVQKTLSEDFNTLRKEFLLMKMTATIVWRD